MEEAGYITKSHSNLRAYFYLICVYILFNTAKSQCNGDTIHIIMDNHLKGDTSLGPAKSKDMSICIEVLMQDSVDW